MINSPKLKHVLKTFISGTNTSSQTFTPFTGESFINDCLLPSMSHFNHPVLQLSDITDPLLSTAALFPDFIVRGFRPDVDSCLARWILRSHMQYAIKIANMRNMRDIAISGLFRMAAAAILDFLNFKFVMSKRSRGSNYVTVLNFVEITETTAEM